MDFLSFFRSKKTDTTANMARDRLMIAVGVQRGMDGRNAPSHSFMPQLREELLAQVRAGARHGGERERAEGRRPRSAGDEHRAARPGRLE